MDIDGDIRIRAIEEEECQVLETLFGEKTQHSASVYTSYFEKSQQGECEFIIAEAKGQIAGFGILVWNSAYEDFKEEHIPEIKTIEVAADYRRKGIATAMMDELEKRARADGCTFCGAGVGLAEFYEDAQNLYEKRGYQPDGKGIFYIEEAFVQNGLEVDDNQALMMIKPL